MKQLLEQLQALIPLAAAATQGPWHKHGQEEVRSFADQSIISAPAGEHELGTSFEDAAFIAAARNLLTPENLTALCAALDKPVADTMGAAEAKYFAHLSDLSPALLLAEWNATEEVSYCEPESYKPEYVRLLLQALSAALAPQWVSVTERLPEENGVYLVFGNCTGKDDFPPTEDMARFYVEAATFSKYRQPTHWMPLPTPPTPRA